MRLFVCLILAVVVALPGLCQQPTAVSGRGGASPLPFSTVHFSSEIELKTFAGVAGLSQSLHCGNDGSVFAQLIGIGGFEDVVRITPDGVGMPFRKTSISGVIDPGLVSFFPADDGLYAAFRGTVETKMNMTTLRTPDGRLIEKRTPSVVLATYIVRFGLDGSFRSATKLDLPFRVLQIGVFDNGTFLVAGASTSTSEPKVALLKNDGQLDRYLELQDDIGDSSEVVQENAASANRGFVAGALFTIVATSELVPDRGNILLVRRGLTKPRVFEISASGEVRSVVVRGVEAQEKLHSIIPVTGRWLVQFVTDREDGMGLILRSYFVSRETGRVLRQVNYDEFIGLGMACYNDGEYIALRAMDGKLSLLKGADRVTH